MQPIAYLNGEFMPLEEARVPIEDRGYQFADGVYEVVVAPDGQPFRLQPHLDRLRHSLEGIALPLDVDTLDLPAIIDEGIRRCGFCDVLVYVQITRGVAPRAHALPKNASPSIVLTFKAAPTCDPAMRERGVSLLAQRDIRWARCDIKSTALLPAVLLKNEAKRQGYFDTVIVSDDDTVREASSANVFIVSAGMLKTPPKSERILHGITRAFVLECAEQLDVPCAEVDFKLADMLAADEAFITSTTMNIMPVTSIDQNTIGIGTVGHVTSRLMACFHQPNTIPT